VSIFNNGHHGRPSGGNLARYPTLKIVRKVSFIVHDYDVLGRLSKGFWKLKRRSVRCARLLKGHHARLDSVFQKGNVADSVNWSRAKISGW
jgi:hypothetical protein